MANAIYRVSGRYMSGTEVTHYRLMRNDGVTEKVTREKAIVMIDKGLIENMRIQVRDKDDIIIRGKGINLNNLPVFTTEKKKSTAGRLSVAQKRLYNITRRMMRGTACIGYEVADCNGVKKLIDKKTAQKLALDKMLGNAEIQKYNDGVSGEQRLILRGVGCDLLKLDVIVVNEEGKIVETNKESRDITIRAILMNDSGIIIDKVQSAAKGFSKGEFIVYGVDGDVNIVEPYMMKSQYIVDKGRKSATCDSYLGECSRYIIKMTSGQEIPLEQDKILKWTIIRKK